MHRGWFIRVQRATFLDPDGVPFERDIVLHPGAVAVVAVTGWPFSFTVTDVGGSLPATVVAVCPSSE